LSEKANLLSVIEIINYVAEIMFFKIGIFTLNPPELEKVIKVFLTNENIDNYS
jgi:hypothetical protein